MKNSREGLQHELVLLVVLVAQPIARDYLRINSRDLLHSRDPYVPAAARVLINSQRRVNSRDCLRDQQQVTLLK